MCWQRDCPHISKALLRLYKDSIKNLSREYRGLKNSALSTKTQLRVYKSQLLRFYWRLCTPSHFFFVFVAQICCLNSRVSEAADITREGDFSLHFLYLIFFCRAGEVTAQIAFACVLLACVCVCVCVCVLIHTHTHTHTHHTHTRHMHTRHMHIHGTCINTHTHTRHMHTHQPQTRPCEQCTYKR